MHVSHFSTEIATLVGCLRALSREVCFRKMFSPTFFPTVLRRDLPHLMAAFSPSLAHLALHGRIFPLMATSSPSYAKFPLKTSKTDPRFVHADRLREGLLASSTFYNQPYVLCLPIVLQRFDAKNKSEHWFIHISVRPHWFFLRPADVG